jgi:type IV pilus assembly protein PilA
MNDQNGVGANCATVAQLANYGFAGTALPTPSNTAAAITLTGNAANVVIDFTAPALLGGYVYDAQCAGNAGGNIVCTSTGTDTIAVVAGLNKTTGAVGVGNPR